jgi:hypothetical protein
VEIAVGGNCLSKNILCHDAHERTCSLIFCVVLENFVVVLRILLDFKGSIFWNLVVPQFEISDFALLSRKIEYTY